jgi:hypothetical protein
MRRNDMSNVKIARARKLPMIVSSSFLRTWLDAVCYHNSVVSATLTEVGSKSRLIFFKLYLLICSLIYMHMHTEQENMGYARVDELFLS